MRSKMKLIHSFDSVRGLHIYTVINSNWVEFVENMDVIKDLSAGDREDHFK